MMAFNADMVNSLSDGASDVGGDGCPGAALEDAPRSFGAIAERAEQGRGQKTGEDSEKIR